MPAVCGAAGSVFFTIRLNEFNVRHRQSLRKLIQGNDCWITQAAFKAAEILLAESGARFDLLLRQPLCPAQSREIPTNQFAHIHTQQVAIYTLQVYKL
jgi:hypothetical protein